MDYLKDRLTIQLHLKILLADLSCSEVPGIVPAPFLYRHIHFAGVSGSYLVTTQGAQAFQHRVSYTMSESGSWLHHITNIPKSRILCLSIEGSLLDHGSTWAPCELSADHAFNGSFCDNEGS